MSNPHMDEAQRLVAADGGWSLGYETADAQHIVGYLEANMQATLALACEQRTANLIAVYSFTEENCGALNTQAEMDVTSWASIAMQIKDRLDLA